VRNQPEAAIEAIERGAPFEPVRSVYLFLRR
jgi:hypothetical protein